MKAILKGINWIIGGIRIFVAGFFGTVFMMILLPTIIGLAEVLSYGVWMLFHAEFYLLVGLMTAIISISILLSKVVVPDIKPGE